MRTLHELTDIPDPAWALIQEWLRGATNRVEALPASDPARAEALVTTQVTTRSPMGAIVYETGGLLVDGGWLRILGSGHPRLPRTLPGWNLGRTVTRPGHPPRFLLVADDVLGGFFAVNGGGLSAPPGNVCYLAPDTLDWESLGLSYSEFIQWCMAGDVARFYTDSRWPGWEADVAVLPGDQGYSVYPPLWSQGPVIAARHRGAVALSELWALHSGKGC